VHGSLAAMKGRANNFDGLRLIGALLVVFSHQFAVSGRWEPRFLGGHSFGNLGVLIFFSISGYLVAASWRSDPNLWRYLSRRFLRMAPGLAVCMSIVYAVVSWLGLLGFPDNPMHMLNGPLWTIPLEVYCYLVLAALGLVMSRPALPLLLVMVVLLYLNPSAPTSFYHFGLFFGLGAVLHQYPGLLRGKPMALLALWGVFVILWGDKTLMGLAMIVPPLTIWVGTRSWPVLRDSGRFGDLSYGIYIYAWPVQQIGVAMLGADTSWWALIAITLAATLPIAWASWRYVEEPCLRFKPSARRTERLSEIAVVDVDSAGGSARRLGDLYGQA
jgi:peptidoglycan/LPS O-acetylase OafA/YrhL